MVRRLFCCLAVLVLTLLPARAHAAEIIHFYLTQLWIEKSGDLKIKETIVVTAEREEINRGIYRDLPIVRHTSFGGVLPVEYEILSVKKDGLDESWHFELGPRNKRIYIGEYHTLLDPGQRYTYEILYTVPKQIFFFDDHEELHWNVIGTGWIFPIEKGGADIVPPPGVPVESFEVFTGRALWKGRDFESKQENGHLMVKTTRTLNPYEGITVVVNFPKGSFAKDNSMTDAEFFWRAHKGLEILLFALALIFFIYVLMWMRMGRDPKGGAIIPQYDPPEGVSPAMSAQILNMGMAGTKETLTAAIVSLAAKGFIKIKEMSKGTYEITRIYPQVYYDKPLSEDEKVVIRAFESTLVLKPGSQALAKYSIEHTTILDKLCRKKYYNNNYGWWFTGMALYLGVLIAFTVYTYGPSEGADFWIGVGIWVYTEIVYAIIFGTLGLFRRPGKRPERKPWHHALALVISGLSAPVLFAVVGFMSFLNILILFAMSALVVVMRHLLRAPTKEGREVMDHLIGFQYYMEAVEEKVLQKFDPPQMSRELYEKYLPYAIALKVDSKWGEKFALAAAAAATAAGASTAARAYGGPSWYSGSSAYSPSGGFSMASITNSIASTVSASSGSSSSGGSGGGGGGGGGGGW